MPGDKRASRYPRRIRKEQNERRGFDSYRQKEQYTRRLDRPIRCGDSRLRHCVSSARFQLFRDMLLQDDASLTLSSDTMTGSISFFSYFTTTSRTTTETVASRDIFTEVFAGEQMETALPIMPLKSSNDCLVVTCFLQFTERDSSREAPFPSNPPSSDSFRSVSGPQCVP